MELLSWACLSFVHRSRVDTIYLDSTNVFESALHNILIKNNYRSTESAWHMLNTPECLVTAPGGKLSICNLHLGQVPSSPWALTLG